MENEVGKLIKARLKVLKRTQGWLAEKCEVSNVAVTKWIKFGTISRENAIKAADILLISIDKLLGNDLPMVENELERQLLMFFRGMSHDHQDDVLRISNSLYDIDKPVGSNSNPYPVSPNNKNKETQ